MAHAPPWNGLAGFAEVVNCAATTRPVFGVPRVIAQRGAVSLRQGSALVFFRSECED
jgi:hypothetical protein